MKEHEGRTCFAMLNCKLRGKFASNPTQSMNETIEKAFASADSHRATYPSCIRCTGVSNYRNFKQVTNWSHTSSFKETVRTVVATHDSQFNFSLLPPRPRHNFSPHILHVQPPSYTFQFLNVLTTRAQQLHFLALHRNFRTLFRSDSILDCFLSFFHTKPLIL